MKVEDALSNSCFMAFELLHVDKLTDCHVKAGRCDAKIFYWKYDKNVEKLKLWE